MSLWSWWEFLVVLEDHGSICSFFQETALQKGSKLAIIEHNKYSVEKNCKLVFNASIFLGCTWGSILKVDLQHFLFAGSFEGLIFSSIIVVKALYLQIELNF